jgi:Flp pilus assembly pilin Flp
MRESHDPHSLSQPSNQIDVEPGSLGTGVLRTQENLMLRSMLDLWSSDEGQDMAEYAVMLAVIIVVVIGTVRLVGGNVNNAFSSVASMVK